MRPSPISSQLSEILYQLVRLYTLAERLADRQPLSTSTSVATRPSLTWNAEGLADRSSRFYSRVPHHPSHDSGVTIGRGYDMQHRSREEVLSDLIHAGVSYRLAQRLSKGAGLRGVDAAHFVEGTRSMPHSWEISAQAEQLLFVREWERMREDVRRISERSEVRRSYGSVDWNALDPRILELVVDLRYRGDYTPRTRRFIQPILVHNDWAALGPMMSNRGLWPDVPEGRFKARQEFMMHSHRHP
jgi:hypothetical protein